MSDLVDQLRKRLNCRDQYGKLLGVEPLHELLLSVVEAADEAVHADNRREPAMGCYMIRLEDALAALREAVGEPK